MNELENDGVKECSIAVLNYENVTLFKQYKHLRLHYFITNK